MIVIPPIDCTVSGVLVSTNAVDAPAWVVTSTYIVDYTVSYNKRNWISVQSGNIGKIPGSEGLWWVDAGPINSLAMFDNSVQTSTVKNGGLTFTLSVGRFTAIGFMGLKGQSITVTITAGSTILQTETRTLLASAGTYYSFCFDTLDQTENLTLTGLLSSPNCQVQISITSTGEAACGMLVIGKQFFIGKAQYGFNNPIEDRGRHYLDALSNPVNVERGYSKGASGELVTDILGYNRLLSFLATNIGLPLLWSAAPDQADLVSANVFGRYVRALPVIASQTHMTLALDIAGYR